MSIETKTIHNDELRVLTDLLTILTPETTDMDPLKLTVLLRRAEVFLADWRTHLRTEANSAYVQLQGSKPDQRTWPIEDLALLTNYTPAGSWSYPPDIVKLIGEVKAKQELAKQQKTATMVAAPRPDPTQVALFAISLKDTPA
jgi:hypothetical protein